MRNEIYSKIFLKIMQTTDLQESTQKCGKDFYDITITKCLWHTACAERFCDGALPGFFENGSIARWLERLKELDIEQE